MGQWPLIGLLGFALLFEFGYTYSSNARGFPILFCSLAAALVAVLSPRRPADALLGIGGILLVSAVVTPFLQLRYDYPMPGGVPFVQVIAGMGVIVNLTRARGLSASWPRVACCRPLSRSGRSSTRTSPPATCRPTRKRFRYWPSPRR